MGQLEASPDGACEFSTDDIADILLGDTIATIHLLKELPEHTEYKELYDYINEFGNDDFIRINLKEILAENPLTEVEVAALFQSSTEAVEPVSIKLVKNAVQRHEARLQEVEKNPPVKISRFKTEEAPTKTEEEPVKTGDSPEKGAEKPIL